MLSPRVASWAVCVLKLGLAWLSAPVRATAGAGVGAKTAFYVFRRRADFQCVRTAPAASGAAQENTAGAALLGMRRGRPSRSGDGSGVEPKMRDQIEDEGSCCAGEFGSPRDWAEINGRNRRARGCRRGRCARVRRDGGEACAARGELGGRGCAGCGLATARDARAPRPTSTRGPTRR